MVFRAVFLTCSIGYTIANRKSIRVHQESEGGLDCSQARVCGCDMCRPDACIVPDPAHPGKCKWPDDEDWCKAWLEDQCATPERPAKGGLGALLAGGGIPLPGMTYPKPTTSPTDPPEEILADSEDADGSTTAIPAEDPEENSEDLVDPDPSDDDDDDATDVEVLDPLEQSIRYVDCNHHRQCGCDECSPVDCIVKAKIPGSSVEDNKCMWPPSQDFCVKWIEDQCGGNHESGKPRGGLGDLLAGGSFPGKKHLRPVKPNADKIDQETNRGPTLDDLNGVNLKPVQTTSTTTVVSDGPVDAPICKTLSIGKKGCSGVIKRQCPVLCAKFD